MKTVLIPIDFSAVSYNALNYALDMAGPESWNIIVLNTYQVNPSSPEMMVSLFDLVRKNSEEGLENAVAKAKEHPGYSNHQWETRCLMGDLVHTVEDEVVKNEIDLVIMGTTGASGLTELLVGSNTSSIMRNATTPVLAVPDGVKFKPYKSILFSADLKAISGKNSLKGLIQLAKQYQAHIQLLNVHPASHVTDAKEAVEGLLLNNLITDIPHTYHFVSNDDVADGVEQFVAENQPDLVVVLARKTGFVERLMKRSITKRLACHTDIPLLALHE